MTGFRIGVFVGGMATAISIILFDILDQDPKGTVLVDQNNKVVTCYDHANYMRILLSSLYHSPENKATQEAIKIYLDKTERVFYGE